MKILVYFVSFMALFVGLELVAHSMFGDGHGFGSIFLFFFAFVVLFIAYQTIECKEKDITKILRNIASIVTISLATGIPLIPFILVANFDFIAQIFVQIILMYTAGFIFVGSVVLISKRKNKSSKGDEWDKIIRFK